MLNKKEFNDIDFTHLIISNLVLNGVKYFNISSLNQSLIFTNRNELYYDTPSNFLYSIGYLNNFPLIIKRFMEKGKYLCNYPGNPDNCFITMSLKEALVYTSSYNNTLQIYAKSIANNYMSKINGEKKLIKNKKIH